MCELDKGIDLKINGESKIWHGILINSVGDMPVSNVLAGTKEGVGFAFFPCRICLITRDELDSIHHESQFVLRDLYSHNLHIATIMPNLPLPTLPSKLVKLCKKKMRNCAQMLLCLNFLFKFTQAVSA